MKGNPFRESFNKKSAKISEICRKYKYCPLIPQIDADKLKKKYHPVTTPIISKVSSEAAFMTSEILTG